MSPKSLRVDIWSDIACPWCYVGKRRLEAALERFESRDCVEVVWHAFELDPSAPRVRDTTVSYVQRLADKYGTGARQAQGMIDRMTEVARGDGLDFHFELIQPGNTFDAHRVLHLAREKGKQDAVKERLLRGYLSEGAAIGEPETLVRLAGEAGLEPGEVRAMLASDAQAEAVRADEAIASKLGIHAVPFFVVGERFAISGAQPAAQILHALTLAWKDASPEVHQEGAACGPDGCG